MVNGLSAEQVAAYHQQGFLVLPDFASRQVCARLRARAEALVDEFEPSEVVSVFSTQAGRQNRDTYFMESGDKIRFFFEEEAFQPDGSLAVSKARSINKIGHALHDLDPQFAPFSRDPRMAAIAASLNYAEPLLIQSMYIFKQPGIGGEVLCHQDSTFLYTDPPSVMGFWFALEDATLENGCLWALPGGHRLGLKSRYVRKPEGGTTFVVHDDSPFPEEGLVPLEVSEGTLVLLHGALPHMSHPNRSAKSRHAYAVHIIDGACDYPTDNWLLRGTNLPARGFTDG